MRSNLDLAVCSRCGKEFVIEPGEKALHQDPEGEVDQMVCGKCLDASWGYEPEEPYITVYCPIAGWKAVMVDSEGPIQTGHFAFATREEAVRDALSWATAEGISCKV